MHFAIVYVELHRKPSTRIYVNLDHVDTFDPVSGDLWLNNLYYKVDVASRKAFEMELFKFFGRKS